MVAFLNELTDSQKTKLQHDNYAFAGRFKCVIRGSNTGVFESQILINSDKP
jgi:hypothetical protein